MIASLGHNLAALKAFGTKMDVTAKNIANVNSDGYKKSRATLVEDPKGSVGVDIDRVDLTGQSIDAADGADGAQKAP